MASARSRLCSSQYSSNYPFAYLLGSSLGSGGSIAGGGLLSSTRAWAHPCPDKCSSCLHVCCLQRRQIGVFLKHFFYPPAELGLARLRAVAIRKAFLRQLVQYITSYDTGDDLRARPFFFVLTVLDSLACFM